MSWKWKCATCCIFIVLMLTKKYTRQNGSRVSYLDFFCLLFILKRQCYNENLTKRSNIAHLNNYTLQVLKFIVIYRIFGTIFKRLHISCKCKMKNKICMDYVPFHFNENIRSRNGPVPDFYQKKKDEFQT